MKRLIEFLGDHGESLIFALAIVVTMTVVAPTMQAHAEAKQADRTAQK